MLLNLYGAQGLGNGKRDPSRGNQVDRWRRCAGAKCVLGRQFIDHVSACVEKACKKKAQKNVFLEDK